MVEKHDLSLVFKATGLEVVTWKMDGERQRGGGVRPGPGTGQKKEGVPAKGSEKENVRFGEAKWRPGS